MKQHYGRMGREEWETDVGQLCHEFCSHGERGNGALEWRSFVFKDRAVMPAYMLMGVVP